MTELDLPATGVAEARPDPVAGPAEDDVRVLTEPAEGVPAVVDTPEALAATIEALRAGSGPVAVDAERAHGFRYSQRAYLLQLRRRGSGTHLVDPVAFAPEPPGEQPAALAPRADLSALADAISDAEWIIHAASQDLACLYEVGLAPKRLFDTELAARLLGYPRVALGTMLEELFGVRLLKEHSASDWSTRPLPVEWLSYAALDVELLIDLRDALAAELDAAGKAEWAAQEFAALAAGAGRVNEPRADPWRRTSGIHRVRTRRGLAVVARFWYARDEVARRTDRAPGKVLPDLAISDLAALPTPSRASMRQIPAFSRRQSKRYESTWNAALDTALGLSDADLPAMHQPSEGPPQARLWPAKDPVAAARLAAARRALTEIAERHTLPQENLLTPDYVRRLCWRPPEPADRAAVVAALQSYGARPWQIELTADALTAALVAPALVTGE